LLISLSKVLLQKEAWGYHQKEKKRERKKKERDEKNKRKMRIKIAHVLTKIFQSPNKERDMF